MGRAKEWMMEQDERGYNFVHGNICINCLTEDYLQKYITENAIATECDYCENFSEENIAAVFDDVMGVIVSGIRREWNDPDSEYIMYVSREGGYQASLTYTCELFSDYYELTENDKVIAAMLSSIQNEAWVEREYYGGTESDRLRSAWSRFCDSVMYKTRYVFLHQNAEEPFGDITPARFLYDLADFMNNTLDQVSLIRTIKPETSMYRVRIDNESFHTASELGSPPQENAIESNRMSPAGIPMFYAAFDVETSIKETYTSEKHKQGQTISIGVFQPLQALQFLDLESLPLIPSIFDPEKGGLVHPLRFFRGFAEDIAKPIAHDGHEHIEYVPTQIVTEFFRHIYKTNAAKALDGIIYRSSKDEGKSACVVFCENNQTCNASDVSDKHMMRLVSIEHRSLV